MNPKNLMQQAFSHFHRIPIRYMEAVVGSQSVVCFTHLSCRRRGALCFLVGVLQRKESSQGEDERGQGPGGRGGHPPHQGWW